MKASTKTAVVILAIVTCALALQAQSGRRQTKSATAAPMPAATPERTPTKVEKKEAEIIFYVGAEQNSNFSYYPYSYYDAVLSGCSEVLRHSSADVDVTNKNLPRAEAIKKSKETAKTYTVLLQLSAPPTMATPALSTYDQIELEYVVFAPESARVVTFGRTYQNANRKGPVVVGPTGGPSGGIYREVLLKRAGELAGERILNAMHLSVAKTN